MVFHMLAYHYIHNSFKHIRAMHRAADAVVFVLDKGSLSEQTFCHATELLFPQNFLCEC